MGVLVRASFDAKRRITCSENRNVAFFPSVGDCPYVQPRLFRESNLYTQRVFVAYFSAFSRFSRLFALFLFRSCENLVKKMTRPKKSEKVQLPLFSGWFGQVKKRKRKGKEGGKAKTRVLDSTTRQRALRRATIT